MSYGIYVGRDLTADGLAYLAGYGDEPSSHWLELVARQAHPAGATITVGVTPQAKMPGRLADIPQVAETFHHLRVSYSHYRGVPAPLTNGGLNEHGVAVRDIWSTSRAELIAMTPADQTGPNYSDLARLVLERARNARAGVALIGALIAQHGYSTYGGNSHLIADAEEAWVVIEFAGGRGLWAAERLGARSIRVSRPGWIGAIPEGGGADFLFAPHLMDFAQQQGWWRRGTPFDLNAVLGDGKGRWAGVQWMEGELAARASRPGKLTIADLFWALRTPRITGDTAGYGQVVPLLGPCAPELRLLWHAHIGAIAAPFVPVFLGVEQVPEEYRQHRYLTEGEAALFEDERHGESVSAVPQGIESTRSATASHRRLLYLLLQRQEDFLAEVTAVWEALERRLLPLCADTAKAAGLLLAADERDLAARLLTYVTGTELRQALDLVETLAASLEARTRLLHGIRDEARPRAAEQIW